MRRYSSEQWAEWIQEQQKSGLSIAAFCDSIGVSANAFYWRRRQLAENYSAGVTSSAPSDFVALRLRPDSAGTLVEVDLPCGATVRVCDENAVGDVVAALLNHGAER
ncbi:MAG: transposase [Fuerstiella sp.]